MAIKYGLQKFMKINKNTLILFGILIFSFLIRSIWTYKSPPSLNWDEASLGYNAYSILKTGKDEYGKLFPISLRSFDDYKGALYSYLSIPFIYIFNLNEFSTRLVSILSGTFIVYLIYLITKRLLKNEKVALISAILVSIEPWSIHFSRAAFETNLSLALFLTGIYFLIEKNSRIKEIILGTSFLVLSCYAYHSSKILLLPTLFIFLWPKRNTLKKYVLSFIIILVILLLPLTVDLLNQNSLGRLESTSILKVWSQTKNDPSNYIFGKSFIKISQEISVRYLSYFSPINLFIRGTPEPTQNIPNFGMFYNFEFIFWLFGLYLLFKNSNIDKRFLILLFILPIPAVITWNWFYPARVLTLFSFYSIIIASGIYNFFLLLKKNINRKIYYIFSVFFITFIITSFFNLSTTLLFYMPYTQKGSWQFGMKQIVSKVEEIKNDYSKLIVETRTAQPYIFYLYYLKYDPLTYQKYSKEISSPRKVYDFDKYSFRDIYWPKDKLLKNVLFVGPESSLPLDELSNNNYQFDLKDWEDQLFSRFVGIK